MSTHVHHLAGCAPTPLAHYLKALGILRLVAEQADATARGWWRDETFWLATTLDRAALERFFLHAYRPTPMISPWNGGSGFYEKDQQRGIRALERSTATRFAPFREAIASGHRLVGRFPETAEGKLALQTACRQEWRGPLLTWFDAALVLTGDGTPRYPALLGTGGNDGRLDFPNNYMQRLAELFGLPPDGVVEGGGPPLPPGTAPVLGTAIFGDTAPGLVSAAIGQFLPGGAGGANSSAGFGGDSRFNPWDFVLMLEGALLFAASVVRRAEARDLPQAAAPFATYADAVGYGTAAEGEKRSRGEQWMPLWERPATTAEIRSMMAEGRARTVTRGAARPIDFSKAVARLGVARGIAAFQRYGYLERYGQNNLAIPLGRWTVTPQPDQNLLDEVGPWIQGLAGAASDDNAPNALRAVVRRCQEAELACTRRTGSSTWQTLLLALAGAELQITRNPQFAGRKRLRPLPKLGPGWIGAADDGQPEFRLAVALAGLDGVEAHWLPLKENHRREFEVRDEKLAFNHRVVCAGRDLEADCIALLQRRSVELHQGAHPDARGFLPLRSAPRTGTNAHDIAEFLAGRVDDDKILRLALALMPVRWREASAPAGPARFTEWNSLYCLFRLASLPEPLDLGHGQSFAVKPDAAMLNRLAAGGPGDLTRAADIALRRLRIAGLRPKLREVVGGGVSGRRLAASLAFGVSWRTARQLAARLLKPADDPVFSDPSEPEPEPTQP